MKKLLFILSAIFVSVISWAQLNPYAYGLSSSWDATNQTLRVDFKLNNKENKIEIFAVDRAITIRLTRFMRSLLLVIR